MKIAFVGKGGSGKSSVSWLMVKTLENMGKNVLAIDADHNMDLTSNLGLDPDQTPLMHKTDKEFMEAVGLKDGEYLISLVKGEDRKLPTFSINPSDIYTTSISSKISNNLSLINMGLGSPDLIHKSICSHGLSGPLKYYLGLLDEKESFVVIDSVAGTDMLNYGLYAGIDAVITVVEPNRNSIKVFEQINSICRKTMIPCFAIINKPLNNDFYKNFKSNNVDKIIGEIPLDENIMNYKFSELNENTISSTKEIIEKISNLKKRGGLNSIKEFQKIKN